MEVSDGSLGVGMDVEVEYRGLVDTVDGVAVEEKSVDMVPTESRLLETSAEFVR